MNNDQKPIRLVPTGKVSGTASGGPSTLRLVSPVPEPCGPSPAASVTRPEIGANSRIGDDSMAVGNTVAAHSSPPSPGKASGKPWWPVALLLLTLVAAGGTGLWFFAFHKHGHGQETGFQEHAGEEAAEVREMPESPEPSGETPSQPAAIVPQPVKPVLSYQTVRAHCEEFGGRMSPEAYAYVQTDWDKLVRKFEGNPIYFMCHLLPSWFHFEVSQGEGHIFVRDDRFFLRGNAHYESSRKDLCLSVGMAAALAGYRSANSIDEDAGIVVTNALRKSSLFPSPVVFSFQGNSETFLYLNESGNPSVLEWGVNTNDWFWCHEGEHALRGYAQCLHELRDTLVEYTQIAKEEGITQYRKTIAVTNVPDVYLGRLDAGTRKKAFLSYEFSVASFRDGITYRIKETTETADMTCTKYMDLKDLDENLELFSRFETMESTEEAFGPLRCFLTQQKIVFEEAAQEATRVARRFEGNNNAGSAKKKQSLTFMPIAKQVPNACVELEATAESGGNIVFSVDSGPGTIDGKTLTFTGSGKVVVRARQWGNDTWMSATAIQEVQVEPEEGNAQPSSNSPARRTSGEGRPQRTASTAPIAPELEGMVAALEAVQRSRTPANFAKMEAEWKALPETWKSKLQKSVIGASCAMFLAKGHPERAGARKALVDERALWTEVSNPCHDCRGKGKHQERCRVCGGSGLKRVRCSTCQGSGNCSFCHGSGQAGGRLGGRPATCPKCGGGGHCSSCSGGYVERACADCSGGMVGDFCRTCHGAGRIISQEKCGKMVRTNIEKALSICRGQEVPEDEDEDEDDDFGW